MKIGIAITHHNRNEILKESLINFKKYLPDNYYLVVVDDCSDIEENYGVETYRFNYNVGIARAKNKCIELLMSHKCTHLFLFDDDTYPIHKDWYKKYINSGEPHLMYNYVKFADGTILYDAKEIYRDDKIVAQGHPRGCMLYLTKEVVDKVGGFNTDFGMAMGEHVEYSQRIFNAGFTKFKFADIIDSNKYIYSSDFNSQSFTSSISKDTRVNGLKTCNTRIKDLRLSSSFVPYIQKNYKGAVITSYFTCGNDIQRNSTWIPDKNLISPLIKSVKKFNEKLIILNDCGWNEKDGNVEFINVNSYGNPYFWRWYAEYLYLRDHDLDLVWLVDATDVEMLEDPFYFMDYDTIYSGDEPVLIGNSSWLIQRTVDQTIRQRFTYNNNIMLNCGLVGGNKKNIMQLCRDIWDMYVDTKLIYQVEMPLYNYFLLDKKVVHGKPVNTMFKHDEKSGAWWKHK